MIALFILPSAKPRQRDIVISAWSKNLLAIFNIRVVVHGTPPDKDTVGAMFVSNHISWVDIHAINSIRATRFIAKAEVRNWPIFGWLAVKANTLFINRDKKQDVARVIENSTVSLLHGECICYFPEGTTTDGTELKVFKGSLIQAAINSEGYIWPVAVHYPNPDGSVNTEMAFAGETTLVESIWKIVSIRNPVVHLHFAPHISSKGHDRRGLTIMTRKSIESMLHHIETSPESPIDS